MVGRTSVIPIERIDQRILLIRGHRVMIDADLAALYGVSTKAMNQAVKRNAERFPPDFAFRLTGREKAEVVTHCDHLAKLRYSPVHPYVFTEHGAIMAANVLNSRRSRSAARLGFMSGKLGEDMRRRCLAETSNLCLSGRAKWCD